MVNDQVLSLGRSITSARKNISDFHSTKKPGFNTKSSGCETILPKERIFFRGRWYVRTVNPVKDSSTSQTTAVLVISTEITETKQSLETLFEDEKKYKTLFDFSPQTTLLVNQEGTVLDVNERITEWIGYTPDEILEKNFSYYSFTKDSKKSLKKIFSKIYK
jgi:PAS domain-containing protein